MFKVVFIVSYSCWILMVTIFANPTSTEVYNNGNQYTVKSVGITYTQRISSRGQCVVALDDYPHEKETIAEGEIIKIKNKWFKVEDCRLNRAYPIACNSKLFYQMLSLVCSFVDEQHYQQKLLPKRQSSSSSQPFHFVNSSPSDVCCKNACTISEFTQYCPSKW